MQKIISFFHKVLKIKALVMLDNQVFAQLSLSLDIDMEFDIHNKWKRFFLHSFALNVRPANAIICKMES